MRPIIRPAMNTARMANTSMPYRPEPTPPNTTSPSCISTIGTMPPSGVNESCMALTAPQEAAVVTAANSAEAVMPKRVSLPSMLPPACSALALWSTPSAASMRMGLLLGAHHDHRRGDKDHASSPPARPSPGAGRRPCGRTRSTGRPGSGRSPASARSSTAASGSRTGGPSSH